MSQPTFVDHYETLQVSPNADAETIERVYRLLAKRYHPDNQQTGDLTRFRTIRLSYEVLSDPDRRAQYDVGYEDARGHQWKVFDQDSASEGPEHDREVFHATLSLLYVARRRDPESGGLGPIHLERMLGVPREHLEFPLWYLMKRGWVERLMGGQLAITVAGVDVVSSKELLLNRDRLLDEATSDRPHERIPADRQLSAAMNSDSGGLTDTSVSTGTLGRAHR